jgi:hypothetical protein
MDGLAGGDWLKITGWRDIVLLWRLLEVIPVEVVLAFDTVLSAQRQRWIKAV